jgi:VWFA-related protein
MAGTAVLFASLAAAAQADDPASQTPTLQVTSKLVFLDVTVVDKKGRPVTSGLTKDDFTITEDRKPQRIFSFEAPAAHALQNGASADNPDGKAPRTILVLDELNDNFSNFAYIRWEAKRFLSSQPRQLPAPMEMMVAGNDSLELVQAYTRDREELLTALRQIPAVLPYKVDPSFWAERFVQSFDILNQIALENSGVPGRKNIVWVGVGAPGIDTTRFLISSVRDQVQQYARYVTNLLVDARMTLFVINPDGPVGLRGPLRGSAFDAGIDYGDDGPFATSGDMNFGVFIDETGGKLFYNRNDLDQEMREALAMGSEYYTLTYQPHGGDDNGRFRRIRVSVRNPDLRVVTKAGYYAADAHETVDPHRKILAEVVEAARSTIPFDALQVAMDKVVRHPDTQSAEFIVTVQPKDLAWHSREDGRSGADVLVVAASLSDDRRVLAFKIQATTVLAASQDMATLAAGPPIPFPVTIRIPKKTKSVRAVVGMQAGGRMGAAEVSRKDVDAAPAAPTPTPQLNPRTGGNGAPPVSQP